MFRDIDHEESTACYADRRPTQTPVYRLRPTSADIPALKAHFKSALEVLEGLCRQRFTDVPDTAQ